MTAFSSITVLAAAFLAVFLESTIEAPRHWLGAQVDLLPALVVYVSLTGGATSLALLSLWGGLWFDSLSANPLGASVLPLFVSGLIVHQCRELILREQIYAQFVLGLGASALTPLLTVVLLLNLGEQPLLGWGSLWQWLVMAAGGGLATPVLFKLFDRLERAFNYRPRPETSFRHDREIKRGHS